MISSILVSVITHVVIYRFTHCLTRLSPRTSCCVPLLVEALNRSVSCRRDGTSLKWWWRVMNWWLKNRWVKRKSKQEEGSTQLEFKLLMAFDQNCHALLVNLLSRVCSYLNWSIPMIGLVFPRAAVILQTRDLLLLTVWADSRIAYTRCNSCFEYLYS